MCFNVLHMQNPKVRTKVRGHCSPPNNFARSVQMKWVKRLNSPSILFQSAKKIALPNSLGWPLRHAWQQFTQKRQVLWSQSEINRRGDLFSLRYWRHRAHRQMWAVICKTRPLKKIEIFHKVLLVFCIAGTVKVKSSGIQVGDLIIVEKVCHKSFYPHLDIVWLLWTFKSPFMLWWIMRESFNLLQPVAEVKGVSKDFIIFWSMLSLVLSNSMRKHRHWASNPFNSI